MIETDAKAPTGLSKAAKKWFFDMIEYAIFTPAEIEILKNAAITLDNIGKCRKEIDKTGLFYYDKFNNPRKSPSAVLLHDYTALFYRLVKELGLKEPKEMGRPGRW